MQYIENTKDLVSFTDNNFIPWKNIGKYITVNPQVQFLQALHLLIRT